jgi:HSP20 family protein
MVNRKISPDICAYYDEDDEELKIEIELPGVKKNDIMFKINEDGFFIRAPKDDYEYIGSYALCCPVMPDKAEAQYADGLLTVSVPYKEPFDEAVTVEIK